MSSLGRDGASRAEGSRSDLDLAILREVLCQQICQRLRGQLVEDRIQSPVRCKAQLTQEAYQRMSASIWQRLKWLPR
eukprot:g12008.t1